LTPHVVLAVVVVDETRAKHQGRGEREGCVVMVRRSFSKRTDRCSAVNKLQISGADSKAVNNISGAFNNFLGYSTAVNSSQQQSTAVNSSQQQSTKFWGHSALDEGQSTAVNKISGAFNSSQHDIQHDIQNGRFVRLLES
jgi:putative ribosome biogenesis GTPase RsgA